MRRLLAAFGLLAGLVGPAAAVDYAGFVEAGLTGFIRPATQAFADTAADLAPAVRSVCAAPSETTRRTFAEVNSATIRALGRIGFLRFGPLAESHRLERLAFLPDPRGIGQRQIRKLVADRDPSALDTAQLAAKSVAVQGLTALQIVAFDDAGAVVLGGDGEEAAFLCGYAAAITDNVGRIGAEVASGWADPAGYSRTLLEPAPDAPVLRSPKDAAEQIFNALVTGLIVVKDQDLLPALGKGVDSARANRIPFSRSGDGVAYLTAEIEGLHDAWLAAGYERDLDAEGAWIPASLAFEFANALKALAGVPAPVRRSMADPATYDRLAYLVLVLNSLRDMMALNLAGSLGMTGGFNALDGD
ncbi:imelysin family protein [Polymorphum gilvum]|uniref:Imelysin-like domain-containing protein n=1 Tax=Polymorphum gilvum (strain LMG 25793 / CGMCC 1.9160 / SL003B-26A1) TaxID=991905 RepID=F2J2X3_POLGS|nr:imelysin family protein [Polymorphum gilvum]ADZ68843.1 hypothetical protein SL003B_0408 [Polymorphum gilvum SL003B-26A1]